MCIYIYIYIERDIHVCMCMYVCIYIERERERLSQPVLVAELEVLVATPRGKTIGKYISGKYFGKYFFRKINLVLVAAPRGQVLV